MGRKSAVDPIVPAGFASCPVDVAYEALGRKWSLLILRNLLHGDRHFNEMREHLPGVNPRILSQRLKELESQGLVARRVVRSSPVAVEYALTEKGHAILPVLRSLAQWSVLWAPEKVLAPGQPPTDPDAIVEAWQRALVHAGQETKAVLVDVPAS
jgi:DNA-binding HxlR family transcriptional regulator